MRAPCRVLRAVGAFLRTTRLGSVALACALGVLGSTATRAAEPLVVLARPGPWSGVSGLIGYGERLWFVNSVKFVNHNSADLYSYDPATGETRYERHLFSQDAGDPVVAGGRLYWPFEDPRFSAGRGEYVVTNGRDWQWRTLPDGRVFHVHAMAFHQGALFAATSAWRAGLQRSDDGGRTWRVVYDHPTPPRLVSRLTTLASVGDSLYAGLTALYAEGSRLLRLEGDTLRPVSGWPMALAVHSLAAHRGWLYGLHRTSGGDAVWRTDGKRVERVAGPGGSLRALARGPRGLWGVTAHDGGGTLWRSVDGVAWSAEHRFRDAEPLDVTVYAGRVYVGTLGPSARGTLWGPPPPAPAEPAVASEPLPSVPRAAAPEELGDALERLDRALVAESSYGAHGATLRAALERLALHRTPEAGAALGRRLDGPFPDLELELFGGALTVAAADLARWQLLWAMARTGSGRVPSALLAAPWSARRNRAEKYQEPAPAAAWAVSELGQADQETVGALIGRLGAADHPRWLDGDLIGALTALTGQRFGYDLSAWKDWWTRRLTGGLRGDRRPAPPAAR